MYKALLCDMDGTLIDSEKIWHEQSTDFYRSMVPSFDPADQKNLTGKSMKGSHAFCRNIMGWICRMRIFYSEITIWPWIIFTKNALCFRVCENFLSIM
ncbi:hypothetical protein HC823_00870 [Candidatus Gracilibacteria bacterium]|nr:hypothetical protein [Candidatus Gracilibacteria bacterium]